MLKISQDLFLSSRKDINDPVHCFIRFYRRNKKAYCHLSLSTSPGFQTPLFSPLPVKIIHTLHMQSVHINLLASKVRIYFCTVYRALSVLVLSYFGKLMLKWFFTQKKKNSFKMSIVIYFTIPNRWFLCDLSCNVLICLIKYKIHSV